MSQAKVLVASSDVELSQILATILGHCGLAPVLCSTLRQARSLLAGESIDLVFSEDRMDGGDYRDVLRALAELRPGVPLIVFSRLAGWGSYVEAVQQGASDCIAPPFLPKEIGRIVYKALTQEQDRRSAGKTSKTG